MTREKIKRVVADLARSDQGGMDLNEDIALITGHLKVWISKHRRWNLSRPGGDIRYAGRDIPCQASCRADLKAANVAQ